MPPPPFWVSVFLLPPTDFIAMVFETEKLMMKSAKGTAAQRQVLLVLVKSAKSVQTLITSFG